MAGLKPRRGARPVPLRGWAEGRCGSSRGRAIGVRTWAPECPSVRPRRRGGPLDGTGGYSPVSPVACAAPLSVTISSTVCGSRTVANRTSPSPAVVKPYTPGRGRLLYAKWLEK